MIVITVCFILNGLCISFNSLNPNNHLMRQVGISIEAIFTDEETNKNSEVLVW